MRKSVIVSAIVTYVAIPVWLLVFCQFMSYGGRDTNTAGLLLYMMILMVVGVPFAFIVSALIAPLFNKLSKKSLFKRFLLIVGFHGFVFVVLYLLYNLMQSESSEWTVFLMIPWYLLVFLSPPSLVGCMTYTFFPRATGD